MISLVEIYRRDGGVCYLCGRPVALQDATRDHVVPKAAGGTDAQRNLRLAHRRCNHTRGAVHNGVDYAKVNDKHQRKGIVTPNALAAELAWLANTSKITPSARLELDVLGLLPRCPYCQSPRSFKVRRRPFRQCCECGKGYPVSGKWPNGDKP